VSKTPSYTGPFDGTRSNAQPIEKRTNSPDLEVHSIFYTVQGEGPFCGRPAVFVRLAGCNLQCPMCDTEYTEGRKYQSPREILAQVSALPLHNGGLVVVTGGEPFRQNLSELFAALCNAGFYVQVETNGTMPLSPPVAGGNSLYNRVPMQGFNRGVYIVCSPKTNRVQESVASFACAYKYVIDHESVNPEDGLPLTALQHRATPMLARPPDSSEVAVYVQPADTQDEDRNKLNTEAALKSCVDFGYTIQLQIHKHLGVE